MHNAEASYALPSRLGLVGSSELTSQTLLVFYLTIVVISLTAVEAASGVFLNPTTIAVLGTASLLLLLPMFWLASFSFGYMLGVRFFSG